MFEDIPRNVWEHSPEYSIPPIPCVPRIPFPVPVFLVLYIAFPDHIFNNCNFLFDLILFIWFNLFLLNQCNHLSIFDLIQSFLLDLTCFLIIQYYRLTVIDLIQTLEFFLIQSNLTDFYSFNPLFFIQSYWYEVVDLFYSGEFSVNHICCLWNIENRQHDDGKSVIEQSRKVSCIGDNGNK